MHHFHQYLYGRRFTFVTDHQPLVTILVPKRGIPALAAARLQCWAITLSAYQYQIEFRNTREHANADGLSRLPLPTASESKVSDADVFTVAQVDSLPVTADQIERATRRDPVLSEVWRYTKNGGQWQSTDALKPYWNRRQELSVQGGCVMWGIRVVVPANLVLQELHSGHQGVVRICLIDSSMSILWVVFPVFDHDFSLMYPATNSLFSSCSVRHGGLNIRYNCFSGIFHSCCFCCSIIDIC